MGVETDQELVQLVGSDSSISRFLSLSLEECSKMRIFTQLQALAYIGNKSHPLASSWMQRRSKVESAKEILAMVVLSHIPVKDMIFGRRESILPSWFGASFWLGMICP
jgi:DNA-directed RNA polymerase III subunit RPC2